MRFNPCSATALAVAAATLLSGAAGAVVTRGDIEGLARTATSQAGEGGVNALASELCGGPVDALGALPNERDVRANLQSWLPLLPSEGSATVRMSGVGISLMTKRPTTGPCEGTITFKYRFRWVEQGDNIVGFHENLESEFTEAPKVVREGKHAALVAAGSPPSPPGSLDVTSDSTCILRIDGVLAGDADAAVHKTIKVALGEHALTCASLRVPGVQVSHATKIGVSQPAAVAFLVDALERSALDGGITPVPGDVGAGVDSMLDLGGGVLEQVSSGLQWTRRDSGADLTWDGARKYCEDLSTAGGAWRLPNAQEFQDLYVYSEILLKGAVACGEAYCSKSKLALTSWWFWTSERRDPAFAWAFMFQQGYGFPYPYPIGAASGSRALCVRSPRTGEVDTLQDRVKAAGEAARRAPAVEVKEIDRGGAVLEQASSGLQWTQEDNARDIGWNEARKYCDQLPLAGGKWRMPTMYELQSLYADAVGTTLAKCGTYLCGTPPGFTLTSHWFWTSNSEAPGKGQGFFFDTGFPGTGPEGYSYHARVLCVRSP